MQDASWRGQISGQPIAYLSHDQKPFVRPHKSLSSMVSILGWTGFENSVGQRVPQFDGRNTIDFIVLNPEDDKHLHTTSQ